jgi:hypothetical protein
LEAIDFQRVAVEEHFLRTSEVPDRCTICAMVKEVRCKGCGEPLTVGDRARPSEWFHRNTVEARST